MPATFKVILEGLQSREKHDEINTAIQRAVTPHLAGVDLGYRNGQGLILNHWHTNGFVANAQFEAIQSTIAADSDSTAQKVTPSAELGRFEVNIDGVELGESIRASIASAIQLAVLPHIADLDYGGDRVGVAIPRPPREWWGLIYRPVAIDSLPEIPQ